jgi:hypothetical protein
MIHIYLGERKGHREPDFSAIRWTDLFAEGDFISW